MVHRRLPRLKFEMWGTRFLLLRVSGGGLEGGGLGLGFAAEGGGGDEGDEEVDGERLDEGVEGVDEGVLVELLVVADGGYLGLDGFGGAGGGLGLLDLVSEVGVHGAVHEVEVDDLPGDDVEGARR